MEVCGRIVLPSLVLTKYRIWWTIITKYIIWYTTKTTKYEHSQSKYKKASKVLHIQCVRLLMISSKLFIGEPSSSITKGAFGSLLARTNIAPATSDPVTKSNRFHVISHIATN